MTNIIFFGSFLEHSAQVLKALHESDQTNIIAVVTTPPRPAGRKKELKKTHVHEYADVQNIPVFTPENLNEISPTNLFNLLTFQLTNSNKPHLFLVAGYGKILPKEWLEYPNIAPINIHFSLLPKYRGAMPAEWAIMMDESETGVSLIEMSSRLDGGNIYAQAKYSLQPTDTRETVYQELYPLGARLFLETLDDYLSKKRVAHPQIEGQEYLYAKLLNKKDSYIPWKLIELAMNGKSCEMDELTELMQDLPSKILTQSGLAESIERMVRALYGWPGVWTEIETPQGTKRMKIHSAHIKKGTLYLDQVQIEGQNPKNFDSF